MMRPFIVLALCFVALPARATVLFEGDFETGDLSQWSKAQSVAPDRIQVVTAPLRQGQYAARFEVRQGDDPIDASGNRAELVWTKNPEQEGDERWYGWSTLWPDDYPSEKTWQLFVQWHHSGCCGSPPLELYVNGETLHLRVGASQVVWTHPLQRGSWHDFVLHAKWSSDPKVAYVELWYDGELVLPKTYGANMYAGDTNYLKMGLYRNEIIEPTGVVFHDALKVGTTKAEVEPPPGPDPDAGSDPEDGGADAASSGGSSGDAGSAGSAGSGGAPGGGGSGAATASGGSSGGAGADGGSAGGSGDDSSCQLGRGASSPAPLSAALLMLAMLLRRGALAAKRKK